MFGYSDSAGPDFSLSVYAEISSRNVCWAAFGDFGEMYLSWDVDTSVFHTYYMDNTNLMFDGSPVLTIDTAPFTNTRFPAYLFKYNSTTQNGFIGRVTSCILYRSGRKMQELIPALRNADGVPGMWDKVSKQFFVNSGAGTFGYRIKRGGAPVSPMSLRDPWRVAPSGVYARLIAENELEIVADTEEVPGEGWEWFTNTAEAYEYFGITEQEPA